MAREKTREELIANGFCPICSKSTAQMDLLEQYVLHGCRRCGVMMVDASGKYDGPFTEITHEQWDQFKEIHLSRVWEAGRRAIQELPDLFEKIMTRQNVALDHAIK